MSGISSLTGLLFVFKGYRRRLVFSQVPLMITALCSVAVATLTQRK